MSREVLDSLLEGATIEPGIHTAEVKRRELGGKKVQKLEVR